MIPKKLRISGFLSYLDPVELDFSSFDLACISGANGAGKSTLLDAITWALFGQARKKDESIINSHPEVKAAEVIFTFQYEEQIYRVIRMLARGKPGQLEFQILHQDEQANGEIWRPLTEHTVRETQAKIVQVLRLDYETFINAAFFLQGKADLFSQLAAGKRKEILGDILGLGIWEKFKEKTSEQRKNTENEVKAIEVQLKEIEDELAEEPERIKNLKSYEEQLKKATSDRKTQEDQVEILRRLDGSLRQKRAHVQSIVEQVQRITSNQDERTARLQEKTREMEEYQILLAESDQIEAGHDQWIADRSALDGMEKLAEEFRILEKKRSELQEKIRLEHAKKQQEINSLETQHQKVIDLESNLPVMEKDLETIQLTMAAIDEKLAAKETIQQEIGSIRENRAKLGSDNDRLRSEMDALNKRKVDLTASEGATCPLCGQDLDPDEKQSLLDQIEVEGKNKSNQFKANKEELEVTASRIEQLDKELRSLGELEKQKTDSISQLAGKKENIKAMQLAIKDWTKNGSIELSRLKQMLDSGDLLPEVNAEITQLDTEISALAYDAESHAALRKVEGEGRNFQEKFRQLSQARSAVTSLENEIQNINKQLSGIQMDKEKLEQDLSRESAELQAEERTAPDLEQADLQLAELQNQEHELNQEVGAARQKVSILKNSKARKEKLGIFKIEFLGKISKLKSLERAFSKDGVPAMLIEQALPEIESHANELLDRLSDGTMSVRFETQSAYKAKKREDLKETLDILISDGSGVRDYGLYSGGEAFRIDFAIRLALSKVLAHRKGARLQTLVIDEGFGSQDANGRQKLIEAINTVRPDFEKILVITHLDELKDAFQTRIEVTKTLTGSTIQVV